MFRQLSRQMANALPSSRILYSRPVHTTPVLHTDLDNTEQQKPKWTAYPDMTIPEAEQRLGLNMEDLRVISVDEMLANAKHSFEQDVVLKTKEKVYSSILRCIQLEGYPTEANPHFVEAIVSDLALFIIGPIVVEFRRKTGRNIRLRREKDITSTDNETGGTGEFVVTERISLWEDRSLLIIEAKHSSTEEAMKHCLLVLKDARDNNGGGIVYGFITTGETWQMLRYDGMFQVSEEMRVLFETMGDDKEKWIKNHSNLVDCMYAALSTSSMSYNPLPLHE